jgi:hypothetical protein
MANADMSSSPNIPPVNPTGAGTAAGSGMDPATERRFERVVSGAHEAVDSAAESVAQAAERLRTQAQRFSDFERECAETCRARVRDNPLSYLAGALVLGVLLGRLSR